MSAPIASSMHSKKSLFCRGSTVGLKMWKPVERRTWRLDPHAQLPIKVHTNSLRLVRMQHGEVFLCTGSLHYSVAIQIHNAVYFGGGNMKGIDQPHLRLVVDNSGRGLDALRYAQSTSGRSSSQNTEPPVSRSSAMASFSEQLRKPYATLRKCPNVVSHFTASDSLSSSESPCQND